MGCCARWLDSICAWPSSPQPQTGEFTSQICKLPSRHWKHSPQGMAQFKNQSAVELSLNEAAEMCHLSPSHFSRVFKQIFRTNYSEYVLRHKLYSAARLLSQSTLSITQISYELNFSSPSHFIAQFKKLFSVTPRQFRTTMTN